MPRHRYKTEPKQMAKENIDKFLAAIKAIAIQKKSLRAVSKSLNIDKSKLFRYMAKMKEENLDPATASNDKLFDFVTKLSGKTGGKTIFNVQQEHELMKYIRKACEICNGLSITELKILAHQYAQKIGIEYPASWNHNGQASADWYYAFMHRHKNVTLRPPEQVSAHRKAFSKETLEELFADLDTVFGETILEPHRIWIEDTHGASSIPSTSSAARRSALREVSPIKKHSPSCKSNHARMPMKTTILIDERKKQKAAKPPEKRSHSTKSVAATMISSESSDDEDVKFCIICMGNMRNNAIHCNECYRAVHLKCANLQTGYYTCEQCELAENG
ncbi:uncharacterized protein LOC116339259 isoform X2 [Contarinia nasturtii]|nr:uncharacterized protein LOC116339259 isoform X2 [Contarinia nasturtii]